MQARQLLDDGQLSAAITQLGNELRTRPDDHASRVFLFELLVFAGELDRAGKQIDAIGQLGGSDTETLLGVQVYRNLLDAERTRARLFQSGVRPRFILDPPEEVTLRLEALELLRQGRGEEARQRIDQAEDLRALRAGTLDGQPFDDLRDADDLLASVLEVMTSAGYFWVPWEHVQYLEVPPPERLRDLFWTPARLAALDGQLGEVFLPSLYPGSHAHSDEGVRLGRKTEWLEQPGGLVRGAGRKLLLIGDEPRTPLDLGCLQFPAPAG